MSDHLPECFLSGRCSPDEPNHGFCGNSDFLWCMHCEKECICERIKRAERRTLSSMQGMRRDWTLLRHDATSAIDELREVKK